jgi:hAT family C-terminal dimerisation region
MYIYFVQDQIFNTWLLLNRFSPRDVHQQDPPQEIQQPSTSKLDQYFHKKFSQQESHPRINKNDDDVKRKISNLSNQAQLPLSGNVLLHWEIRRYDDPILYQLSQVILAVPPTQVSVERAFSALGLILTSRRNRLADNTINNLLVCKLNPDVFDQI